MPNIYKKNKELNAIYGQQQIEILLYFKFNKRILILKAVIQLK